MDSTAQAILLPRLEQVRANGRSQYLACCPAHDDSRPSLSIRETDDGTILLKCWAGCTALVIVQAVGLELSDLFPDKHDPARPTQKGRHWNFRTLLNALRYETAIVVTCANDIERGHTPSADDMARLRIAAHRIARVSEVAE